jgi:TolB-like protein
MIRPLVALALAAAVPVSASAAKPKVAVLEVRAVQGVGAGTASILTAIIAGDLANAGFSVISQSDIVALIGFEKQKQIMGCGEDSSCLAEIGGALGAEYVLMSQVGRIGSRFHMSIQLLDGRKGVPLSRVSRFSNSSEDALAEAAQRAVAEAITGVKTGATPARAPPVQALQSLTQPAPTVAAPLAAPSKGQQRGTIEKARRLLEKGDSAAALDLFSRVLAMEPKNTAALAGRGLCYLDLESYATAESSFLAALELDPAEAEALLGLAETYRFQGRTDEAISHYEKYLTQHPEGEDAEVARNALARLR